MTCHIPVNAERNFRALRRRTEREQARRTLDDKAATGEMLARCARYFPAETLEHPGLALLTLTDPHQWFKIFRQAQLKIYIPRVTKPIERLRRNSQLKLTYLILRRARPHIKPEHRAFHDALQLLLRHLLTGEISRRAASEAAKALSDSLVALRPITDDVDLLGESAEGLLLARDRTTAPAQGQVKPRPWRVWRVAWIYLQIIRATNNTPLPSSPWELMRELSWLMRVSVALGRQSG
jgi:hypothetical protein